MKRIIILGGGLAGLISSIKLISSGIPCTVIEKKSYPFNRVCGEYISNEAVPFLKSLNLYPEQFNPPVFKRFQLSSGSGRNTILPLELGGFGISRFVYDHFLYEKAKQLGVDFLLNTEVENISYQQDKFEITTHKEKLECDVAIGAFGKRSKLDVGLQREFIKKRSPYVGIKYHVRIDHDHDLIALHNFKDGYCGISNIEEGKTNLCYLTHRNNLKMYGDVDTMQEEVLFKNPLLKSIFNNADFIFKKPEVINEISFETKAPVEDHIIMVGDAAGMITPLCGNGMAMAIRSAKIASDLVIRFCNDTTFSRAQLEYTYKLNWKKNFAKRLWNGRQVQRLFGNDTASNFALNLAIYSKPIANFIIRNTHGETF